MSRADEPGTFRDAGLSRRKRPLRNESKRRGLSVAAGSASSLIQGWMNGKLKTWLISAPSRNPGRTLAGVRSRYFRSRRMPCFLLLYELTAERAKPQECCRVLDVYQPMELAFESPGRILGPANSDVSRSSCRKSAPHRRSRRPFRSPRARWGVVRTASPRTRTHRGRPCSGAGARTSAAPGLAVA